MKPSHLINKKARIRSGSAGAGTGVFPPFPATALRHPPGIYEMASRNPGEESREDMAFEEWGRMAFFPPGIPAETCLRNVPRTRKLRSEGASRKACEETHRIDGAGFRCGASSGRRCAVMRATASPPSFVRRSSFRGRDRPMAALAGKGFGGWSYAGRFIRVGAAG